MKSLATIYFLSFTDKIRTIFSFLKIINSKIIKSVNILKHLQEFIECKSIFFLNFTDVRMTRYHIHLIFESYSCMKNYMAVACAMTMHRKGISWGWWSITTQWSPHMPTCYSRWICFSKCDWTTSNIRTLDDANITSIWRIHIWPVWPTEWYRSPLIIRTFRIVGRIVDTRFFPIDFSSLNVYENENSYTECLCVHGYCTNRYNYKQNI